MATPPIPRDPGTRGNLKNKGPKPRDPGTRGNLNTSGFNNHSFNQISGDIKSAINKGAKNAGNSLLSSAAMNHKNRNGAGKGKKVQAVLASMAKSARTKA